MGKVAAEEETKEAVAVYQGEDASTEESGADEQSKDETALAVVGEESEGASSDSEYEFKDLRRKVLSLRAKTDESYWDLAVALEDVYERGCYRAWGFESWKDYVENEIDIQVRKAQYLVQIQKWTNELSPNIQAWIRSIGWTKARMLVGKVTEENAREWRARIDGKSVAEIEKMLKEMTSAEDDGTGPSSSDDSDEKPKGLNFKLFPLQMDNWKRAAEIAMGPAESDKPGNLLDLICTDYIASNMTIRSVGDLMSKYEKVLGLRLIAYNESEDRVVYGEDLIRQLDDEDEADEPEAKDEVLEEDSKKADVVH